MAFSDGLSVQRTSLHSSPQLRHVGALAPCFGAGLGAGAGGAAFLAAAACSALAISRCAAVAGLMSCENWAMAFWISR